MHPKLRLVQGGEADAVGELLQAWDYLLLLGEVFC